MEKTINCAECRVEFTFEENPKFPRKYCLNCSAKKKQQWDAGEPVKGEDVGTNGKKEQLVPKDNGFHLTPENINLGALSCAIEFYGENNNATVSDILGKAERFKKYIVTGE